MYVLSIIPNIGKWAEVPREIFLLAFPIVNAQFHHLNKAFWPQLFVHALQNEKATVSLYSLH